MKWELPDGWRWVNVNDVTIHHKQGFYTSKKYTKTGVKLARITDIDESGKVHTDTMPKLDISEKEKEQFKVSKYDVLIARSGAIGLTFRTSRMS